ncbi:MAG: pilus assembly protein TadG-related protein [Actinomycetota bacterium]
MRARGSVGDSGQVAPLVLVCLLGLLALAGLVVDGGLLFSSRRSLQAMADGAARAGAMQLDEAGLRQSGGREVSLEPEAAQAAVGEYLRLARFSGEVESEVEPASVKVTLRQETRTLVLPLAGVGAIRTEATATARPRSGVAADGR